MQTLALDDVEEVVWTFEDALLQFDNASVEPSRHGPIS